jgi:hypothetical protein
VNVAAARKTVYACASAGMLLFAKRLEADRRQPVGIGCPTTIPTE